MVSEKLYATEQSMWYATIFFSKLQINIVD